MVAGVEDNKQAQREFLRVKIDLESFQFELSTANPEAALPELRKIIEAMHLDNQVMYEEFVVQELRATLSEQFVQNEQVMQEVRKLLKQEDDYRAASVEIAMQATIDLEHRTREVRVHPTMVKRAVGKLLEDVETVNVKTGIIHLNGSIGGEDKRLILDHIHKHVPTAQLRAFHSPGSSDSVVVECIFFGDFPEREE